ncbi:MAG TPA: tRNA (adenosine(37)-N6)-threonylcarbamoyltransferase complex dimerization subunit type 1 TsaB [Povalibacter sp.]|uniref:tRNA (adenosine(37)-N6)-threonylcarbamoyltransferase complex dimerization subunit type 1 TsaB n=1 Tax=Povalibacter sp. TaxID=1962978 RepID=UPI002CBCD006|nr:tRNA (adenosine(37)-N6)-threonylcarbamoyltransferase complex dimerization subunit type 1 TsaB [Povalibacter sp.]HMN44638.1 tRNA (adenosine(37)-N6)-threonylcarbamoyltransferase complex dimerization subunit type 1 TsaB [Povalibacter sp.]
MKILAIDTATERCSVALRTAGGTIDRVIDTPRGHADLILTLVQDVLNEAGLTLAELDAIAYGRGPGAFTGVRIAIGVAQGLAFGASLPTVGISDLAAVAQQVAVAGDRVLVCMDARMNEVYWGVFDCSADGLVVAASIEQVSAPASVEADVAAITKLAGTGFHAYPELAHRFAIVSPANVLPRAAEIALLAEAALRNGEGRPAHEAQPVYLRDNVAVAKK